MHLYLFVVHKFRPIGYYGQHFTTSYPVETEEPLNAELLDYYASGLVAAERFCMDGTMQFLYVSAMEVREDKPFGWETKVWNMVVRSRNIDPGGNVSLGLRPRHICDQHRGVVVELGRVENRSKQRFIPACIAPADRATARYDTRKSERFVLKAESAFTKVCWPTYKAVMDSLPGLFTRFNVSPLGVAKEMEPICTWHTLGFAVNNVHHRQQTDKAHPAKQWANNILNMAVTQALNELTTYFNAFYTYDHKWGENHKPVMPAFTYQDTLASTVWRELAVAIGYQIPEQYRDTTINHYPMETNSLRPAPGTLKIDDPNGEVLGCVRALFSIWRFFTETEKERAKHSPPNIKEWWMDSSADYYFQQAGRWYYDRYDEIIYCSFKLAEILSTLQMILWVKMPRRTGGTRPRQPDRQIYHPGTETFTAPTRFIWDFYQVMWPHDKGEFVGVVQKNEATVTLPEPPPPPITTTTRPTTPDDQPDAPPPTKTKEQAGRNHLYDEYMENATSYERGTIRTLEKLDGMMKTRRDFIDNTLDGKDSE